MLIGEHVVVPAERELHLCSGSRLPSAYSRNLLCNMFEQLTLIIGTDATLQFLNLQLPLRFGNGPLAMHLTFRMTVLIFMNI